MSWLDSQYPMHKCTGVCAHTGEAITPGDRHVACLVEQEDDEALDRADFSLAAWEGGARPERLFAFWNATAPASDAKPDPLVDDESLLALFEQLDGAEDEKKIAFRAALTLLLLRKRLLKPAGHEVIDGSPHLLIRRKGEGTDVPPTAVLDPGLDEAMMNELGEFFGNVVREPA